MENKPLNKQKVILSVNTKLKYHKWIIKSQSQWNSMLICLKLNEKCDLNICTCEAVFHEYDCLPVNRFIGKGGHRRCWGLGLV